MSAVLGRRAAGLTASLGVLVLGGCATFGGNVKGSFSCSAPDGICAPSSTIDDGALAMIEGAPAPLTPAGPYQRSNPRPGATRVAAVPAGRSQERVLRVVFPAWIDERGRLHEASAVHAVVETGAWQSALASAGLRRNSAVAGESLAEAVDRLDPPVAARAESDGSGPTPEAVAAARARAQDPIAALKADVAAKLTASQKETAPPLPRKQPVSAALPATASPSRVTTRPVPTQAPDPGPVRAAGFPATTGEEK